MDKRDIRGEPKVLGDVRMVLRRVVAVRDEPDPKVLAGLQLARLVDVVAYFFDVLCCGRNVAALAAGTVLHEDEVAERARYELVCNIRSGRCVPQIMEHSSEHHCTYSIFRPSSSICGGTCVCWNAGCSSGAKAGAPDMSMSSSMIRWGSFSRSDECRERGSVALGYLCREGSVTSRYVRRQSRQ